VAELSERLQKHIARGFFEVGGSAVRAIAADVRSGALPWFVDEFAEAIRNGALTPSRWGELTLTELADDDREPRTPSISE
jgi:hypothetical protein